MTLDDYSSEAEQACALIMGEVAKFRILDSSASSTTSGRLLSGLPTDLPHGYSPILGMVAVIENFVVGALHSRLEETLARDSELHASAQDALAREIDRGWPERKKLLKRWVTDPLDDFTPFKGVEAFIEVRNAIAHGLGRLTKRQIGGDGGVAVRQKLRQVGVTEVRGQLVIGTPSIDLCAVCCKASIIGWDGAARRAPLRAASGG